MAPPHMSNDGVVRSFGVLLLPLTRACFYCFRKVSKPRIFREIARLVNLFSSGW